jgi:hypothetical protein
MIDLWDEHQNPYAAPNAPLPSDGTLMHVREMLGLLSKLWARLGFIDLLVIVAIIGILVGLLMPPVVTDCRRRLPTDRNEAVTEPPLHDER